MIDTLVTSTFSSPTPSSAATLAANFDEKSEYSTELELSNPAVGPRVSTPTVTRVAQLVPSPPHTPQVSTLPLAQHAPAASIIIELAQHSPATSTTAAEGPSHTLHAFSAPLAQQDPSPASVVVPAAQQALE
eukprot:9493104-Pyramimonas_sp.AAC.2